MNKKIVLHDECLVVFMGGKSTVDENTLFIASKENDEESLSCDYLLTKDDARKFRDAIDEWLKEEDAVESKE